MACPSCQPSNLSASAASVVSCQGATVVQQIPDATLKMYAARVGAPSAPDKFWVTCLCAAFMLTQRVIYYKQQPGDCGANVPVNLGITGAIGGSIGVAAAADPEPISKGILSGISTIFGVFGAHHAQAVKTEQATLCDVATTYNGYASAIEQAVASGQLTPEDASQALGQIVTSLSGELSQIAKDCNAACGFKYALQALLLYNTEVIYPALYNAPVSQVGSGPGAPGSQGALVPNGLPGSSLTGAVNSILTGKLTPQGALLLAGAGIVFIKLL